MASGSNTQLRWVGCLMAFGLLPALGFAGYRVWAHVSRAPAAASTLPSARAQAPLPRPEQAIPVQPLPPVESAPEPSPTEPAPGVALRSARVELGPVGVNGKLPPDVVRRILRQNLGRVRLCNEQAAENKRVRPGTLLLRFVIGRDGSVSHVAMTNEDAAPPEVRACIVRAIQVLSFPQPATGTVTAQAAVTWHYGA